MYPSSLSTANTRRTGFFLLPGLGRRIRTRWVWTPKSGALSFSSRTLTKTRAVDDKFGSPLSLTEIWKDKKNKLVNFPIKFYSFSYYHKISLKLLKTNNLIFDVMVVVLSSSDVDCGSKPLQGQIKDYQFSICCFSARHKVLRSKSQDLLSWYQNNVSEWSITSTCWLLSLIFLNNWLNRINKSRKYNNYRVIKHSFFCFK